MQTNTALKAIVRNLTMLQCGLTFFLNSSCGIEFITLHQNYSYVYYMNCWFKALMCVHIYYVQARLNVLLSAIFCEAMDRTNCIMFY